MRSTARPLRFLGDNAFMLSDVGTPPYECGMMMTSLPSSNRLSTTRWISLASSVMDAAGPVSRRPTEGVLTTRTSSPCLPRSSANDVYSSAGAKEPGTITRVGVGAMMDFFAGPGKMARGGGYAADTYTAGLGQGPR